MNGWKTELFMEIINNDNPLVIFTLVKLKTLEWFFKQLLGININ